MNEDEDFEADGAGEQFEDGATDNDALPEEEDAAPGGGSQRQSKHMRDGENKIFVGGIKELPQDRFDEYFGLYGELVDSVVMKDKATGRSRGFGFVQYANAESADRVMEDYDAHSIDGQKFEVKRCVPKTREASNGPASRRAPVQRVPMQRAPAQRARPTPSAAWGPPLGHGVFRPPMQPAYAPGPSPMMTDKVFVGGVGECREDLFIDYFGPYGRIVDVVVMRDKATGKSRGFGYVQFDHPQAVDAIMQFGLPHHVDGRMVEVSGQHFLNGRQVEVKRSIPKEAMAFSQAPVPQYFVPAPMAYAPPPAHRAPPRHQPYAPPLQQRAPVAASPRAPKATRVDKVFVGGLAECPEEEFVAYFEQFGTLVDHVVMKDKATGRPRGFGFVQYDDPRAVDEIMERYSEHQVGGKWVEVKRCVPEDKGGKGGGKGPGGFGGKGPAYGGMGARGGKGSARHSPY